MTLLSNSLKQVEESQMQTRSSVSKIESAIARMEKLLKGKEVVQEREKEVPTGRDSRNFQERIFQENELENVRNKTSHFDDRRRHARQNKEDDSYWHGQPNQQERRNARQNEEDDQYWQGQQNHQERRKFGPAYDDPMEAITRLR